VGCPARLYVPLVCEIRYGWTISATEYVDDWSIEDEWNDDYDLGDCDYIMVYDFWRRARTECS
jgi:hypothetical protein